MTIHHIDPENLPAMAPNNDGRTPAAWATNGLIVLGALIAAIGFMIPLFAVVWVGAGVVVAALVVGAAMRALGHGQPVR